MCIQLHKDIPISKNNHPSPLLKKTSTDILAKSSHHFIMSSFFPPNGLWNLKWIDSTNWRHQWPVPLSQSRWTAPAGIKNVCVWRCFWICFFVFVHLGNGTYVVSFEGKSKSFTVWWTCGLAICCSCDRSPKCLKMQLTEIESFRMNCKDAVNKPSSNWQNNFSDRPI